MAIQIIPILKALAPLVAQAGSIAAGLRSSNAAAKTEERVGRLERETVQATEVLSGLAQQLQVLAEQLRVQAEITERLQRRARVLLATSLAALGISVVAIVLARG